MKQKTIVLLLILCLLVCGCSRSASDTREIACPKMPEGTVPANSEPVITKLGMKLLKKAYVPGENILISPLSVSAALGMAAEGAQGQTLVQMEAVLGLPRKPFGEYMQGYLAHVHKSNTLRAASALWIRDSSLFEPKEDFLRANEFHYGAGIYRAPFDEGTLEEINRWVREHTAEQIPHILDSIAPDAMVYLVNALAFEEEWPDPYTERQVRSGVFTLEDNSEQDMELMRSTEHFYLENEYCTGFLKHYAGRRYAFAALLPKEGITLSAMLEAMDGDALSRLLETPEDILVYAGIPKFEAEYATELSAVLAELGMADAFSPSAADFSAMGTTAQGNPLYISRVLHKTRIEVAEQGTRAGAATVIEAPAESAMEPMDSRTVLLDRPFLYMIIDTEYKETVFLGILADPGV